VNIDLEDAIELPVPQEMQCISMIGSASPFPRVYKKKLKDKLLRDYGIRIRRRARVRRMGNTPEVPLLGDNIVFYTYQSDVLDSQEGSDVVVGYDLTVVVNAYHDGELVYSQEVLARKYSAVDFHRRTLSAPLLVSAAFSSAVARLIELQS